MTPRDQVEAQAERLRDFADNAPGRKSLAEFKTFLLRGNVVDLAIGVAIGAAFTAVVTAVTKDFVTPLIAIFLPGDNAFADKSFPIPKLFAEGDSLFLYGDFINVVISFVAIAAVLFFFVVKPVNHLMDRRKTEPEPEATTHECPECLSKIPVAAKRCAFCTAEVQAVGE